MDEPTSDPEGLHRGKARLADFLRQILYQIVDGVIIVIHDIHNGDGADVAGLEEHVTLGIHNAVEGLDIAVDKLLHDINRRILGVNEPPNILVRLKLIGVVGAHPVVGLHHHGIAHGMGKFQSVLQALYQVIPGGGQAGLGIVGLHGRLILDLVHFVQLRAGGDVELRAQPGIPHEPVLVVAFQPVDFAVLEGEEGHGLEHLVVVFQGADLVIFVKGIL